VKRWNALAAALVFWAAWLGTADSMRITRAAGNDDLKRIQELADTEDPATRRDICRQIEESKPALFARLFCDGYEAIFDGQDALAEQALDGVLKEQPGFTLAVILYGEAYAETGQPDRAEALFQRAIELQPDRSDARFALGSLYLDRAEKDPAYYARALEAFRQLTELDPSSPNGWSSMGLTLARMGRLEDAEHMYERALAQSPKDPYLHDCLASVYSRENRPREAEASWREALSINPGYGPAVIELAALYGRTDRLRDAIGLLERGREAILAPPWGPRIRRNLGFAYLGLDDLDKAEERLREATTTGEDALAFLGLGTVRLLRSDRRGALPDLERGAEIDSSLAIPFARAFRDSLRDALPPGSDRALAAVLARVSGPSPAVGPSGSEAVKIDAGARALPELLAFVLGGWSFADAAQTRADLEGARRDSIQSGFDTEPIPIDRVPAEYPESAQESGLQGSVQVLVTVGPDGRVADARIQNCDAPLILCDSALDAARRWTFKPATRFGSPVQSTIVLPFRFTRQGR